MENEALWKLKIAREFGTVEGFGTGAEDTPKQIYLWMRQKPRWEFWNGVSTNPHAGNFDVEGDTLCNIRQTWTNVRVLPRLRRDRTSRVHFVIDSPAQYAAIGLGQDRPPASVAIGYYCRTVSWFGQPLYPGFHTTEAAYLEPLQGDIHTALPTTPDHVATLEYDAPHNTLRCYVDGEMVFAASVNELFSPSDPIYFMGCISHDNDRMTLLGNGDERVRRLFGTRPPPTAAAVTASSAAAVTTATATTTAATTRAAAIAAASAAAVAAASAAVASRAQASHRKKKRRK